MGVDRIGGLEIPVPEQNLERVGIPRVPQDLGGEGVTKGVGRNRDIHIRLYPVLLDQALDGSDVQPAVITVLEEWSLGLRGEPAALVEHQQLDDHLLQLQADLA